ncbi:MAG: transposase [Bacteroidetes bacterium]|nr:transposase [Bacteroidota bacterium]
MSKLQNKYRNESIRLQTWDYARDGAYFITICTKNRLHYFGEIETGKIRLSTVGAIADILWYEIKNHAKNIELGEFVVMPNHIHGILILTGNDEFVNGGDNACVVPTTTTTTTDTTDTNDINPVINLNNNKPTNIHNINSNIIKSDKTMGQNRFQNQGKNSISSIIGSYKSAVSKHAHRLGYEFEWQSRFYDNIIRNDLAYQRISNYIVNNPLKWAEDNFFISEHI